MSKASEVAENIANNKDNRCVCGGGLDWYDVRGAAILGARALLEWARSKQFNVINDESPVVGIWQLEAYFEDKK